MTPEEQEGWGSMADGDSSCDVWRDDPGALGVVGRPSCLQREEYQLGGRWGTELGSLARVQSGGPPFSVDLWFIPCTCSPEPRKRDEASSVMAQSRASRSRSFAAPWFALRLSPPTAGPAPG